MNNNFKQTDIGLIPDDWEAKRFSDIAEFKNGINFSSDQKGKIGVLTIDVLNMYGLGYNVVFDKLYRVNKEISEGYLLKDGDLLFVRSSLKLEGVGWTALFPGNNEPTTFCGFIIRARVKDNNFNKVFLTYYFRSNPARSKLISKSTKLGITNINQGNLGNITIPQPPFIEQKKIAHVLSRIQQAIETQDKIIKTTQELKKALMQKLFTEGLNSEQQKQTEIGLIPESWEVVALGKYAKILNGYAFKSVDYLKKGVPLIRISNVSFGFLISKDDKFLPFSYLDRYSDYSLKEGDLILSLTRPVTSGGMKYCFIEKRHLPALLNQRVGRFKIIDDRLSKNFLYHLVFSKYFIGELQKLFGSSSQQPNVSPTQLESFKVPFPKSNEQVEIAKILDTINIKIQHSIQSIEFLKALFTSSLNKLMTGQIRVKDINLEKHLS